MTITANHPANPTLDEMWATLRRIHAASEETLQVITDINGYNAQTMRDVLYATTGYRDFDQLPEQPTYKVHYCYDGLKSKTVATDVYHTRSEWHNVIDCLPYDFIDCNQYEIWVDWGDE